MMLSYGHGWELLYNGIDILATHKGRIKERLILAFIEFNHLEQNELEPALWDKFSRLIQEVTSAPNTGEGTITASINKMSEDRASEIATEMFGIFHSHAKTYWTTP